METRTARISGRRATALAAMAVALVVCLSGCTAGTTGGSGGGGASVASGTASYSPHANGSVEASGYVGRSDLEGGFWALYDKPPLPAAAPQPKIVAALLPSAVTEKQIAALKGVFVTVRGRVAGPASVRMTGPGILVDTITPVTSDTPK